MKTITNDVDLETMLREMDIYSALCHIGLEKWVLCMQEHSPTTLLCLYMYISYTVLPSITTIENSPGVETNGNRGIIRPQVFKSYPVLGESAG